VDTSGQLCCPFPEDGPFSFEQTAISGECRRRFSLRPLESQTSFTVDGVDLFDIPIFHQNNITFVKPSKLVIHLIAHLPFPFLWQAVKLLAGLPGTKSNLVAVGLWYCNGCSCVIRRETERVDAMRFG